MFTEMILICGWNTFCYVVDGIEGLGVVAKSFMFYKQGV